LKNDARSKLMLITAMSIYGTIGILRAYISLSSAMLSFIRGIIGTAFLLVFTLVFRKNTDWRSVKAKLVPLAISGILISLNWLLLFEAYSHTTVATATLCYYMAPVFVVLASPLVGEKIGAKKAICVALALAGMVLVSGVCSTDFNVGELKGVLLGLGAAVLYALVVLMNKKTGKVDAYGKTVIQLVFASAAMFLYVISKENIAALQMDTSSIILTVILGVVHTGVAYAFYFGSLEKLEAQTVALYGYIDPAVAIILSAIVLRQYPDIYGIIGTVLILASMMASEIKIPIRQK